MRGTPWVLGISASHDGAAALLRGDELVVAVAEERLRRRKHVRVRAGEPCLAAEYCLRHAGLRASDVDVLALCIQGDPDAPGQDPARSPTFAPMLARATLTRVGHHRAHALSALAYAGWRAADVMIADGLGSPLRALGREERRAASGAWEDDWEATSSYVAAPGGRLAPLRKHVAPGGRWLVADGWRLRYASLGGMYGAVAQLLFGDPMAAGKVMGLAPYGRADWEVEELVVYADGRFRWPKTLAERFDGPVDWRTERGKNLAASVQRALEETLLALAADLRARSAGPRLCFAGGVALNVVANERLRRESGYVELHVTPAANDTGCALGAAYHGAIAAGAVGVPGGPARAARRPPMGGLARDDLAAPFRAGAAALEDSPHLRHHRPVRWAELARAIADGALVGFAGGRSELGPRALGHRSILADPRDAASRERLNREVKRREPFRPFAPAVLAEQAVRWFDFGATRPESPFMLRAVPVREARAERVPAIVHVDGTARVQTVPADGSDLRRLLEAYFELTGVPLLLNTSFNGPGEPIVEDGWDVVGALWELELDLLYIDGVVAEIDHAVDVLDAVAELRLERRGGSWVRRTEWGAYSVTVPPAWAPVLERLGAGEPLRALLVGDELRPVLADAPRAVWPIALGSWARGLRRRGWLRLRRGGTRGAASTPKV